MPIFSGNVNLLIAAPMLQDYLVDKDGTPMSAGIITCYHDNSRTTLKNWYYQTGTPGNYTYIALPNPLTLSAAGTICDANGVDTIPFFYPYSEVNDTVKDAYYITIVNHHQTNQITRANFPFVPSAGGTSNLINTYRNLIVNNGFWRNIAPNTVNVTPYTSVALNSILTLNGSLYNAVVSPSQHDGFRYPDMQFFKNNVTGTDLLTFTPFPLGNTQPISNYNVPEYYVNHTSTSNSMSGETSKYYQIPIALHVNSLANVPFTVSIEAQNVGGTGVGQNVITLYVLQDTGTGTVSPSPKEIGQITLNTSWTSYSFTSIFPATSGLTLTQGSDDALYLLISMPLNTACSINFTQPSIYLTQGLIPNYDFQTYDVANSVFNSPRTGDIRITGSSFYNSVQKWVYGWVPMNEGTIGNANSNATTRANQDTFRLYDLIWNFAKTYDTGSNFNALAQIYTNLSVATNYGSNSYDDFTANKLLSLTHMMGRVIMGTVPLSAVISNSWTLAVTVSNSAGNILCTVSSVSNMYTGQPIAFTATSLPGNIVSTAIYYATNINTGGNTFQVATTYANALAGTPVVAFSSTGTAVVVDLNVTATTSGEYGHTQLVAELAQHSHSTTSQAGTNVTGASNVMALAQTGVSNYTGVIVQPTGNSTPFNIVQPSVFYNLLMKL